MGYKITYLTPGEIFTLISYLSVDNILGIILMVLTIVMIFLFILYIFPLSSLTYKSYSKQRDKAKRKLMIQQIAMQREIEDEIAQSL